MLEVDTPIDLDHLAMYRWVQKMEFHTYIQGCSSSSSRCLHRGFSVDLKYRKKKNF